MLQESYRRRIWGSNLCWTNARQYPQVNSNDTHIPVGSVCIELMLLWEWVTDIDWKQPCNSHTSVARFWLAPLLSRNLTTLSWFSWAAIYRGVKPFCDCMLTEAPCFTSSFTTSSCPAKQQKPRYQFSQWCCYTFKIFSNVTHHLIHSYWHSKSTTILWHTDNYQSTLCNIPEALNLQYKSHIKI